MTLRRFPTFEEYPDLELRLNEMVDEIICKRLRGGIGILVKQTSNGTVIEATADTARVKAPKVQFRGEYDQRLPYNTLDITRVTFGMEAGTYLALKPVPANAAGTATYFPWSGNGYWVLIGRISDQSSWA